MAKPPTGSLSRPSAKTRLMAATVFSRFAAAVENTAAILLFVVTVLSFSAVGARYAFNTGIPDAFDGSRYLLGVVIFWGLASACHRGEHITMDALWTISPQPVKHMIDIFANLVICIALAFFLWQFSEKVIDTWKANVGTIDLNLPVAGFYTLALAGLGFAQVLAVARLVRVAGGKVETIPEQLASD